MLEAPLRVGDRLLESRDRAVHLLLVYGFQNLADARARLHAEREQVPAEENRRRRPMLDAERARSLEEPVHRGAVEAAGAPPLAVRLRDAREQLEVHFVREPAERAVADFVAHLVPGTRLEVLRGDAEHLPADVVAVDRVDVE